MREIRSVRNIPWIISENFNEILLSNEKVDESPREEKRMEAFK